MGVVWRGGGGVAYQVNMLFSSSKGLLGELEGGGFADVMMQGFKAFERAPVLMAVCGLFVRMHCVVWFISHSCVGMRGAYMCASCPN